MPESFAKKHDLGQLGHLRPEVVAFLKKDMRLEAAPCKPALEAMRCYKRAHAVFNRGEDKIKKRLHMGCRHLGVQSPNDDNTVVGL